jgi:hypothetical protein
LPFLAIEPESKAQEVFIFKLDLISLLSSNSKTAK